MYIVQLVALPISLLMIILGQTNAWYGDVLELDLVKVELDST